MISCQCILKIGHKIHDVLFLNSWHHLRIRVMKENPYFIPINGRVRRDPEFFIPLVEFEDIPSGELPSAYINGIQGAHINAESVLLNFFR